MFRNRIFIIAGLLLCSMTSRISGFTNDSLTTPSPYYQVSCVDDFGFYFEGLIPDRQQPSLTERCQIFHRCRPNAELTQVNSEQFRCSDADPSRPYYDAKTCTCVQTNDHCSSNDNYLGNCRRRYIEGSESEVCRGFGETGQYYLNDIPNPEDPHKFFKCAYSFPGTGLQVKTFPHSMNCPVTTTVWDSRTCRCEFPNGEDEAIATFNKHPMNIFNCSIPVAENPQPDESCKDELGRYYVGRFDSNGQSERLFYECVQNGSLLVSTPKPNYCPHDTVFSLSRCDCILRNQTDGNLLPVDRYNCATLLKDCGDGTAPSCQDTDGNFYLGTIPHTSNCFSFYSCIWNHEPSGPLTIPVPQDCPSGLIFNVNSDHCGCDWPQQAKCFAENEDDKFRCAYRADTK